MRGCEVGNIISDVMKYFLFIHEAFPRFNFIHYSRQVLSCVLEQVAVNAPLVRVKLLRAINGDPDLYSYSCLCEYSLSN